MPNIFDWLINSPEGQATDELVKSMPLPAEAQKPKTALDIVSNLGKITPQNLSDVVSRNANATVIYAKEAAAELGDLQERQTRVTEDLAKANNMLLAIEKADIARRNNIRNQIAPLDETTKVMQGLNQEANRLQQKYLTEVNGLRDEGIASEGKGFLDQVTSFIRGTIKQNQAPLTLDKAQKVSALAQQLANQQAAQFNALSAAENFAPAPELSEAKVLAANAKLNLELTKDNVQMAERRIALGKTVFETISQAAGQIQNQEEFKLRKQQAQLSMAATSQQMSLTKMHIDDMKKTQAFFDSVSANVGTKVNAQIFQTLPENIKNYFTAMAVSGATSGAAKIVLPDGSTSTAAEELTKAMGATPAERQQFISEIQAFVPKAFKGSRLENSLKYNQLLESISQEWKPNANQSLQLDQIRLRDPKKAAAQELIYRKQFAIDKLSGTSKDLDGTRYTLDPASPTNLSWTVGNQESYFSILKQKQLPDAAQLIIRKAFETNQIQTPMQLHNALIAPLTAQFGRDNGAKYLAMAAKAHLDLSNSISAPELLGLPRVDVLPVRFSIPQSTWFGSEQIVIQGNLADPVFIKRLMASQAPENQRSRLANVAAAAATKIIPGAEIAQKIIQSQQKEAKAQAASEASRTKTGQIPGR